MKNLVFLFALMFAVLPCHADTSDYIWNQQFEKKMVKAEAGDLKAQYDVGNMYLKGQGTARDAKQAFKWFKNSATKGYARSAYKLGYLYHQGEGVNKNNTEAFKWVSKAAKKSYKPAMYYLGKLYAAGDGVAQDYNKALQWHKKAYAAGYNPAKREIAGIEAKLAQIKQQQVAFDPRPTPVVRAKPKPKPKPKRISKPRPAPKPVKLVQLSEKAVKDILLKNKWQLNNKPAVVLPSTLTTCQLKQGQLQCKSKEMEYDEPYGVVSYIMQATFTDFNNRGEFNAEYNKNVTLIFPNDPDDPDTVIPINYGPQQKELMRCKVMSSDVVCYRGEKREKITYKRS